MKRRFLALGALALGGLFGGPASVGHCGGGISIGVGFGFPLYRPCYPCYGGYYYRPYPVYMAPPPVIVQPAPVVQTVPVVQPVYTSPPPAPVVAHAAPAEGQNGEVERLMQQLADPNEHVRADCVMQLGRLRAQSAIDPLAATLAGDRSPVVREAAARALGLIGSPKAMPALQQAAQVDTDRDVRHSAEFALEVVRTNR